MVERALKTDSGAALETGWDIVRRNERKIAELVLDMLNYSGASEPAREPCHVNDLVGEIAEATIAERRDLILGHFRMVAERDSSRVALHKLRKFTGWYTHGLPRGRKLRQQINSLPDVESFLVAVERFFDEILEDRAA